MIARVVAVIAVIGCSSAPPVEPIGNRASTDAPMIVDSPCSPAPTRDNLATVATFQLDGTCVALANQADSPVEKWPVAWVWASQQWQLHRLDQYAGHEWVGAGVVGGEVVGVLDNAVEAPGWELVIAATRDGRGWSERSRVRKVYYFAVVGAVEITDDGISIAVDLDDDYGAGVPVGRRIYRSTDGGRSWSDGVKAVAP